MNRRSLLRRVRMPLSLAVTAGGAAAVLATSVAPAGADSGPSAPHRKPTVVLVHGAFADSSSWDGVVKELKRDGYPVVAAANPLRGLSTDAAYVRQVVAAIDGPVILVGHSYGGAVISNAARGADNVEALVYAAAFMPDKGESALQLASKYPGSSLGQALHPVPITHPDGTEDADLYIQQPRLRGQFAADVARSTADLMAVAQRPVTNSALEEASGEPAWKTIPSWALVATEDLNIPAKTQRFMAERAGARTEEVRASHAVGVSQPDDVARLIGKAARTVR